MHQDGNTPTSVGKTDRVCVIEIWEEKHPHERGEDVIDMTYVKPVEETPPRAWGRPLVITVPTGGWRNTPTSVGKTLELSGLGTYLWKHPHERGEDNLKRILFGL